jgi:hypothetical protein
MTDFFELLKKRQAIFRGVVRDFLSHLLAAWCMLFFYQGHCFIKVNLFERIMFLKTTFLVTAYGHYGSVYLLLTSWPLAKRKCSMHAWSNRAEIV